MASESKGASIMHDAEREIIKLLKKDNSATYTQYLEVMFADIE
jgi:hypothetical protein